MAEDAEAGVALQPSEAGLGSLFDLVIEEMGKSAIVKDSLKRAASLAEQAE